MGCYDTFIDGSKEIQLKNFGCNFYNYKVGDTISTEEYHYPKDCLFFCWATPQLGFVCIKDSKFVGIISRDDVFDSKYIKIRIWDCSGIEHKRVYEALVKDDTEVN
jgi:hypothetical protein